MRQLKLQPRALRRMVFVCCAGAQDSPMTPDQKTALLSRCLDHSWAPTPDDTPAPFAMVQAWYEAQQRMIPRPMPETDRWSTERRNV